MLKLNLQRGQYEWTVSKTDFETGTASFYSENNLLLRDTLNRSFATVTFQVESASIALANAEVILGTETLLTDSSGSSVFYPVPVDESFSYSVFSIAYETAEGNVSIHSDTIINISIEPLGVNTDITSSHVNVYPNPTVKELFIDQIPVSASKIEVYSMDGSVIFIKKIGSDHVRISVDKETGVRQRFWKTAKRGGPAKRDDTVRLTVFEGSWTLEPVPGKGTRIAYYLHTNPGGNIPTWMVNRANKSRVPKLLKAIQKRARNPKWRP